MRFNHVSFFSLTPGFSLGIHNLFLYIIDGVLCRTAAGCVWKRKGEEGKGREGKGREGKGREGVDDIIRPLLRCICGRRSSILYGIQDVYDFYHPTALIKKRCYGLKPRTGDL
jgi:hypothetical protein